MSINSYVEEDTQGCIVDSIPKLIRFDIDVVRHRQDSIVNTYGCVWRKYTSPLTYKRDTTEVGFGVSINRGIHAIPKSKKSFNVDYDYKKLVSLSISMGCSSLRIFTVEDSDSNYLKAKSLARVIVEKIEAIDDWRKLIKIFDGGRQFPKWYTSLLSLHVSKGYMKSQAVFDEFLIIFLKELLVEK